MDIWKFFSGHTDAIDLLRTIFWINLMHKVSLNPPPISPFVSVNSSLSAICSLALRDCFTIERTNVGRT